MNDIQSLIDRELGIYCRLNYDNVLKRLVVDGEESFYGLQSASVVNNFDQDPPIFACRFSEAPGYEHILALANEDGRVAIQNTINIRNTRSLEGFQCHNNAVFDLAWMPGHMNFVTVSGDHTACLWDVAEGAPKRALIFSAHTRSVKTVAFRPDEPSVFCTGARDGHILAWDIRAGAAPALVLKPDNRLTGCHSCSAPRTPGSHSKRARLDSHRAVSITGLAFQDRHTLLSCGECDGNIKAWDLRKNYSAYTREPLPKRSIPYCGSSAKNGYTNLLLDATRTRLYASCMDDVIYCFNVAAYAALPERRYLGHENGTFYIKTGLSPDGAYLVSGSSDKHAYIWNVRGSSPVARLAGHRAEVTCAAWCQRGDAKIVTCGDDARHMVWRVGQAEPPPGPGGAPPGRAEPAPRPARAAPPAWRSPSALKRRAGTPPARGGKRARSPGPGPGPAPAPRRTKRCLTALMNAADDAECGVKRLRLDPPGEPPHAGVKRPAPPWSYPSPSGRLEARACRRLETRAPSPESPPGARVISFSTPTKDLPNFVLNGEAPHLRLMSPAKKKRDAPDWLTVLARERRRPGSGPGAPDGPGPAPLSPKENVPARRNSASDRTPKSSKRSGTLLKYFTVGKGQ